MRILITGGGTGGHVTPALAVVKSLKARMAASNTPLELLYVGSETGIEHRMVQEAGIPYAAVATGKLRRYFSWRTPIDILRIPLGVLQSAVHVARFRPDVIFSTGGFVCVPPIIAGWILRVPSLTHEQTARSGLANRIAARFVRIVAITFPESAKDFAPGKTVLTGNPIRSELFAGKRDAALDYWHFSPDLPVVYVTGGVLGAHAVNLAVFEALPRLLEQAQVVHQTGEGPHGSRADITEAENLAAASPLAKERYRPVAFVGPELADLYTLITLVIGRAGAGTINELAALGKPSILIPLPGASADEQTANARRLASAGASILMPQSDLTAAKLADTAYVLLADDARLQQMSDAGRTLARPNAAELVVDELLKIAKKR